MRPAVKSISIAQHSKHVSASLQFEENATRLTLLQKSDAEQSVSVLI